MKIRLPSGKGASWSSSAVFNHHLTGLRLGVLNLDPVQIAIETNRHFWASYQHGYPAMRFESRPRIYRIDMAECLLDAIGANRQRCARCED